ncbi:hypothetical protein [Streptomyces albidoflavus]|uniref:hypothetical protein n=1 Tax=Streptomyces albidoflavus TaxID=1886 RepID=UPI00331FD2EF
MTSYDDAITALRTAGVDASHEMLGIGYTAITARRGDFEIRITDLDGPLPDDPSELTGWWACLYRDPGDAPTDQRDFAPADVDGMAAWLTTVEC